MTHKSYVQVPEEYVDKKNRTKKRQNLAEMNCDYDHYAEVKAFRDSQPKQFVDPQGNEYEKNDQDDDPIPDSSVY